MSDSPTGRPVSVTSNTHSAFPFQKSWRVANCLPGGGKKTTCDIAVAVDKGAKIVAWVIFLGYASIPVAVLCGFGQGG